jgi:hypothetical protein
VSEKIPLKDPQLNRIWGDHVYRLRLTAKRTEISARNEFILSIKN